MGRKILGVAVKFGGIMVCLPEPNRHCDCFRYAKEKLGINSNMGSPDDNQGFYTDDALFVNRKAAYYIAGRSGQIIKPDEGRGILFSENLW